MPLSEAELAEAMSPANLPESAADLAAARGDAVPTDVKSEGEPATPAPALTDAEKDEVAAVAKPDAKKDGEGEAAVDEPARDPETGKFIPKQRFDQVRAKLSAKVEAAEERARAAEERAAKLAGPESVQQAEAELKTKTKAYNQLLIDGKLDAASDLFSEILSLNGKIAELRLEPKLAAAATEPVKAQSLEHVVEFYTTEFPEFREGAAEFNQALVDEAVELQTAYVRSGMSEAKALQKAADLIVRANGLKPASERTAPPKAEKKDKGAERKADAVKTAVDAANRQPPGLDSVGLDSDKAGMSKIDVNSLSPDEFRSLPETTLKRLRGDLV